MDDLISRRSAIEALIRISGCESKNEIIGICAERVTDGEGWIGGILDGISELEDLPSAQPELDEWCYDCKEYDKEKHSCPRWNRVIRNALKDVQPERTCVNCGRTVNNGGWYADGRTRCPIEEHYALPKDGYCHLWEKRNVTDDDYPERREE